MHLVPYIPAHLELLAEHAGTMHILRPSIESGYADALVGPHSFTAFNEDGEIIGCGGIFEFWKERGEVWAMLDAHCRRNFVEIDRMVRRMLDIAPYRRLEAVVDEGFEPGHRWVRLLGFELEAPVMKRYRPNGLNASLYARVK